MRINWKRETEGTLESVVARVYEGQLKRRFWWGFLLGMLFMAASDISDFHICVGDCDDQGLSLKEIIND
jgi:hypothetical protein